MADASNGDALIWEPGLYFAAYDLTDHLKDESTLSSTGNKSSTFEERVAEYGTAGNMSTEGIQGVSDSATWVVLDLLIDDLDTSDTFRTALLSSTTSQGGVSAAENDTFGYVYTVVVDNGFVADNNVECEEEEVVVEPDTAAGLFVAGTAAFAVSMLF